MTAAAATVVSPFTGGIGNEDPGARTIKVTVSPDFALEPPNGFWERTVSGRAFPAVGAVAVN